MINMLIQLPEAHYYGPFWKFECPLPKELTDMRVDECKTINCQYYINEIDKAFPRDCYVVIRPDGSITITYQTNFPPPAKQHIQLNISPDGMAKQKVLNWSSPKYSD